MRGREQNQERKIAIHINKKQTLPQTRQKSCWSAGTKTLPAAGAALVVVAAAAVEKEEEDPRGSKARPWAACHPKHDPVIDKISGK